MQVRKEWLELDMEKQTGSKSGKEYVKAVYCHPAYLTYMQLHHEKAREFQKNIYFCFIDYDKAFDSVDHNKLWTILKEMGLPDHLTCLLRNLFASQVATVRTGHGTTDWFKAVYFTLLI